MTELEQYQSILTSDYPSFIEPYLELEIMKKLKTRGQFCGADYTKIFPLRYLYTRFDHSVTCALMTWHFTHDKIKTLSALFHDLGTPAFSHCIDYVKGDYENQESSELDLRDILYASKELLCCLSKDGISITDIVPITKHSIVDIERPGICVDRLDGVLHTNLIWLQTWELEDIKTVYQDMKVLKNEFGKEEIGFSNIETAEYFYEGAHTYSVAFQRNDDKLMMQFITDVLKSLLQDGTITMEQFYSLSEEEIVTVIKKSKQQYLWSIFENLKAIERSERKPTDTLYTIQSFKTKKRYVIPLCEYHGNIVRLNEISTLCRKLLKEYQEYQEEKFAYIKKI